MNRKFVYIILVALAIVLLVALLWWWFLRREATSVQTTGTFGTAQNANGTGAANGTTGTTNTGTAIPQNGQAGSQTNVSAGTGATTQTNIQLGDVGTAGSPGGTAVQTPGTTVVLQQNTTSSPVVLGTVGVPGVVWLAGSTGFPALNPLTPVTVTPTATGTSATITTTGPGTVFNPTAINPIVNSNPTGTGLIPNIPTGSNGQQVANGGSSILGSIGTAAAAGVVSCAIVPALQAAAQQLGPLLGITQSAAGTAGGTAAAGAAAIAVQTIDINANVSLKLGVPAAIGGSTAATAAGQTIQDFMGCLTRNIAKIALQQITNSVVNWINSGFNGSPSFVQNPTQFFQQTADVVAGNYIQSSALSFLCSPFQLQIKIAIAQSYANRNANSCTLTKVIGNVQNFMNGNFLSGNWAGMLSFTTIPTNNPYGAFLYGSIGLTTAQNAAVGQKQQDLLQGQGFLSFQQKQNCTNTTNPPAPSPNKSISVVAGPSNNPNNPTAQLYQVCDYVATTPGTVIAASLNDTLKSSLDQLTVAQSFDQIISALINQLMTRTLQGGLSNLSGTAGYQSNFYTPDQLQAQSGAQALVTQMQSDTDVAGQYAQIQQGSITDIENAQSQLNDLYNCWSAIATTSATTTAAAMNAAAASTTLASLNTTIAGYNNRITLANNAIVLLGQLESAALSAQSSSDVSSVTSSYNSAQAAGEIPSQADVTNAQQNRTTLQSQMATLNTQTQAKLAQCYAAQ